MQWHPAVRVSSLPPIIKTYPLAGFRVVNAYGGKHSVGFASARPRVAASGGKRGEVGVGKSAQRHPKPVEDVY